MIVFEAVTVAYAARPVLREVSFTIPEGELVLVVGPTGSGKTSLLQCFADGKSLPDLEPLRAESPEGGHPQPTGTAPTRTAPTRTAPTRTAPTRTAPTRTGRVLVDGVDVRDLGTGERSALVGLVHQDPARGLADGLPEGLVDGLAGETVESVVAAGVRPRADDPHAGQRQVEDVLDLLGLADLRDRPVALLSGGQQQRVAIGAALAGGPRVLVLDEPTSALDPVAAEEVLAVLHRLVHDVGVTVVMAEHRLERVVHHADSVLLVDHGRVCGPHVPAAAMARSAVRPPVVELGVRLGWSPLPLSVREARRSARELRAALAGATSPARPAGQAAGHPTGSGVRARRLSVVRGEVIALRSVTLQVGPSEVVAVMGRNGAGKSTLLAALDGVLEATSGHVAAAGGSALAPQDPWSLLTEATVEAQLTANDTASALPEGTTSALLERLAPGLPNDRRPEGLSEGQRMCVALSLVLARERAVVLLDEPTRGLDYPAKARLSEVLDELAGAGRTIMVATHDVELAARVATRVVILAEGEVVADGPANRILSDSPAFAPQVAKVMHPVPLLRVDDVVEASRRQLTEPPKPDRSC